MMIHLSDWLLRVLAGVERLMVGAGKCGVHVARPPSFHDKTHGTFAGSVGFRFVPFLAVQNTA